MRCTCLMTSSAEIQLWHTGRLQVCLSAHQAAKCQTKEHRDRVWWQPTWREQQIKKKNLIPCIIFICHEGFIVKPVLLIKETARQNVRDLEREVILKGALEPEQPRESWDTQKMCGCVKWKLKVSGTMIWRSRKDCSTVQTQVCDMRPSCCVECGSKAGHFVKSLEVLKYSCQKEKKKSHLLWKSWRWQQRENNTELFRTKRLFLLLRDIKKFTDQIDARCSVFPKDKGAEKITQCS